MNSAPIFLNLDKLRQPWENSPYSLISWWDMEKFSAAQFYGFGARLGAGRRQFELMKEAKPYLKSDWVRSPGYKLLKQVKKECESIGLRLSAMCIDEFLQSVKTTLTLQQLLKALAEIENSIRREMSVVQFFYMPNKQADFYDQQSLFGQSVVNRFPRIQFDMVEAGNCFAMGRGTACVFHLMRIMEIGVQEFGNALGVQIQGFKPWQNILDEINKAIRALPSKDPKTIEKSEASANLYSVKLAWRNDVMHPNDKYTLEEARNLIEQVRIFMGQLAAII